MALLMFEWSTPSMNAFFMADQIEKNMAAKYKASHKNVAPSEADDGVPKWFKTTSFVLSAIFALTFFVVRILWGHYHYYHFYRVCWRLWYETPAWFNISLMALIGVAFLLNGTWMVQIILTGLGLRKNEDKPPETPKPERHHVSTQHTASTRSKPAQSIGIHSPQSATRTKRQTRHE